MAPSKAQEALQRLAVRDPVVFGEVYSQAVKNGHELPRTFFQRLAQTYKSDSARILEAMGK